MRKHLFLLGLSITLAVSMALPSMGAQGEATAAAAQSAPKGAYEERIEAVYADVLTVKDNLEAIYLSLDEASSSLDDAAKAAEGAVGDVFSFISEQGGSAIENTLGVADAFFKGVQESSSESDSPIAEGLSAIAEGWSAFSGGARSAMDEQARQAEEARANGTDAASIISEGMKAAREALEEHYAEGQDSRMGNSIARTLEGFEGLTEEEKVKALEEAITEYRDVEKSIVDALSWIPGFPSLSGKDDSQEGDSRESDPAGTLEERIAVLECQAGRLLSITGTVRKIFGK